MQQDNCTTVQPEQLKHPKQTKFILNKLTAGIFYTNKDRIYRGSKSQYHFIIYKSCIYIYT